LIGFCQKEQYICDQIGNGAQMIVDCWILNFDFSHEFGIA
jgi:hypothetical protein